MAAYRILDTWGDFVRFWAASHPLPVSEQVERWRTEYMARYPELLRKQVDDYASQGMDWRALATEKVFPHLPERLPLMQEARDNLLRICGPIHGRALETLGLDLEVTFVIYVGIGCGAGWATRYEGAPACLLGLENIAEEGWHTTVRLRGLVAHELGHLAHMAWRGEWEEFAAHERDPLFLLYSEGFAMRCEEAILGAAGHLVQDEEWSAWCEAHRATLAAEFLRRLDAGQGVCDFFGSWREVQGHGQTGYFLGRAFIRDLERGQTLRAVARVPATGVRALARRFLVHTARDASSA